MSTTTHTTIDGDVLITDPGLAARLPISVPVGTDGVVVVSLAVGERDEIRVNPPVDRATTLQVLVRTIELLEVVRDELRAAEE